MKVKIGNVIYDSEKEPIMIILTAMDKALIGDMEVRDRKYCCYPKGMKLSLVKQFMNDKEGGLIKGGQFPLLKPHEGTIVGKNIFVEENKGNKGKRGKNEGN